MACAALLIACANAALAQRTVYGAWHDNTARPSPAGQLHVSQDTIRIGRTLVYKTRYIAPFGNGALFRVLGVNRKRDPLGCGLTGRIEFIAIKTLSAAPSVAASPAITVFFYSGTTAPTEQTIDNDIHLCSVRPFGQ